jgi:integrase
MIHKPEGRRFYSVKFKFNGQTIQRRTKATNYKAAKDIESNLRAELAKRNFGILKPRKPVTLADFLKKDFLPFNETRFATKQKSHAYYAYGAERLCKSDLAKLHLDEITSQHATGFAAKHSEFSPSTINCSLRTLRRALNLAEKWGKLAKAPDIELVKGERQRDRIVSESEFLAYRALCRQPWRDVVTLLYGTGMRPGEAYKLRWENVLLNGSGGLIQIAEGKTRAARRVLPMVPEVYRMIIERAEAQGRPAAGWVFPSGSLCGHFDESSAKNQHLAALRSLQLAHKASKAEQASVEHIAHMAGVSIEFVREHAVTIKEGVKPFEPYCIRHTALTRLAESGCDAFTLAKIAGHSSITITQRYCHPQAEAIERAFAKLPGPKPALSLKPVIAESAL